MSRLKSNTAEALKPWQLVLTAVLLGVLFMGTRGIWDPDEGRYSNVALMMLDTGQWLTPYRNDWIAHWTKPPLTYWAVAASVKLFGWHTWALRFPVALAYLASTAAVWTCAKRLVPARATFAGFIYATFAMTVLASQMLTTDYLLAAFETWAVAGFVMMRFDGPRAQWRGSALMSAGFGLAFLTKGPPGLLPLLAILTMVIFSPRSEPVPGRLLRTGLGILVFLAIAAPWYVAVTQRTPGLLAYFLGDEVAGRIASNEFKRNGQWYGWLLVYGGTFFLLSVPWTRGLLRAAATLPAFFRVFKERPLRAEHAPRIFVWLWLLLPLIVFCISQSRLPLYVLPLFGPLAILSAMAWGERTIWPWWLTLILLLALKGLATQLSSAQDGRALHETIARQRPQPYRYVLGVAARDRFSQHFYLGPGARAFDVRIVPEPRHALVPKYDFTLSESVARFGNNPDAVWVATTGEWPGVANDFAKLGYTATELNAEAPHQAQHDWFKTHHSAPVILFEVRPSARSAPDGNLIERH